MAPRPKRPSSTPYLIPPQAGPHDGPAGPFVRSGDAVSPRPAAGEAVQGVLVHVGRAIVARYPGTCAGCRVRVGVGEIVWHEARPGSGSGAGERAASAVFCARCRPAALDGPLSTPTPRRGGGVGGGDA